MSVYPYLGTNVDSIGMRELNHHGLIQKGEYLLAMFDGILLDEQGKRVGGLSLSDFIILTDQRLITWARGFFSDTIDSFAWKDVDVIDTKTWDPLHGSINLAFRLVSVKPSRERRVTVQGMKDTAEEEAEERVVVNTFDYVPASDVPVMEAMVAWIGDQVVTGITGQQLLMEFANTFPLPESNPLLPYANAEYYYQQQQQQEHSSYADDEPQQKRSWWKRGAKDTPAPSQQSQSYVPRQVVDDTERLIASYEVQRSGDPAIDPSPKIGVAGGISAFMKNPGTIASALDQIGIYGLSRGLRLVFGEPIRVGRSSVKQVNAILGDTAELVNDIQDPKFRKQVTTGLHFAMNNMGQSNILGFVVPVMRTILGSNDKKATDGGGRASSRRRISITADGSGGGTKPHQVSKRGAKQVGVRRPSTAIAPGSKPVVSTSASASGSSQSQLQSELKSQFDRFLKQQPSNSDDVGFRRPASPFRMPDENDDAEESIQTQAPSASIAAVSEETTAATATTTKRSIALSSSNALSKTNDDNDPSDDTSEPVVVSTRANVRRQKKVIPRRVDSVSSSTIPDETPQTTNNDKEPAVSISVRSNVRSAQQPSVSSVLSLDTSDNTSVSEQATNNDTNNISSKATS